MISKEEQKKLNDELLKASRKGRLEKVKELIEKGAKVNTKDTIGDTPLYIATKKGHLEVVKYLVEEAHAEVDERDQWKNTPLHMASLYGQLEVVKYLCEKGADVDARSDMEITPLYAALNKQKNLEIIRYLFLERNALMTIYGMFRCQELMKEKVGRETIAQCNLDYFLKNKDRYTKKEIQEFKMEFLKFKMNKADSKNLKTIVKFL